MKLGILKTDAVRPEWVPDFGEYPDMFTALLGREDPQLEFVVYDVEQGEYPVDIDDERRTRDGVRVRGHGLTPCLDCCCAVVVG